MDIFEIILIIIFITASVLVTFLAVTALQLIKELKVSLSKINRLLDNPQSLPKESIKKFEETITFKPNVKSDSRPRLFHRQQPK